MLGLKSKFSEVLKVILKTLFLSGGAWTALRKHVCRYERKNDFSGLCYFQISFGAFLQRRVASKLFEPCSIKKQAQGCPCVGNTRTRDAREKLRCWTLLFIMRTDFHLGANCLFKISHHVVVQDYTIDCSRKLWSCFVSSMSCLISCLAQEGSEVPRLISGINHILSLAFRTTLDYKQKRRKSYFEQTSGRWVKKRTERRLWARATHDLESVGAHGWYDEERAAQSSN